MPKRNPFTLKDIQNSKVAHLNKHVFEAVSQQPKKNKFSSEKTVVDDNTFDSKREAKRYKELKLLLKAGKIAFLARQVEFQLNVGGTHSMVYKADFVYTDSLTGQQVCEVIVEDVKGFETNVFKKKEKLMKKIHGITIKKT